MSGQWITLDSLTPAPPQADADGTLKWTDVQKIRTTAQSSKLSPGQNLALKQSLPFPSTNLDTDAPTTGVGAISLDRSSKWFTLSDCSVNSKGEIVYQVAVAATKTLQGRVVRVVINMSRPGAAPGGLTTGYMEYFYTIG